MKKWTATLLLAMMAMLPTTALASDLKSFSNPYNVCQFDERGQGIIHITVLECQRSEDGKYAEAAFHQGAILVEDPADSTKRIKIIDCQEFQNNGDARLANPLYNHSKYPAILYCTNDREDTYKFLTTTLSETRFNTPSGSRNSYAEFDWYYPAAFSGKTLKVYATGQVYTGSDKKETKYDEYCGTIEFPSVELSTYAFTLSNDKDFKGYLQLAMGSVRPINNVHVEYYTDTVEYHGLSSLYKGRTYLVDSLKSEGEQVYNDGKTTVGFLKVPATVPHYNMNLFANINVSKWTPRVNEDPGKIDGDFICPVTDDTSDSPLSNDAPMIHAPIDFVAKIVNDGSIQLSWNVKYKDYPDLLEGDMFQIQRSLTGKEEDFNDIGAVVYAQGEENFSYLDEDVISKLVRDTTNLNGGLKLVYRIRRAATNMWEWEGNPTAARTSCTFSNVRLLHPINAKAEWEALDLRTVKVTWDYKKNDDNFIYVWDKRADMELVMVMTNKQGVVVDSIVQKMSDEERTQKMMNVQLSRSCVNYTMRIRVNKKDSPIPYEYFFEVLETSKVSVQGWADDRDLHHFTPENMSGVNLFDGRTDTKWESSVAKEGENSYDHMYVVFKSAVDLKMNMGYSVVLYNPDDAETYGNHFPDQKIDLYSADEYNYNKWIKSHLSFEHVLRNDDSRVKGTWQSFWGIGRNPSKDEWPSKNNESITFPFTSGTLMFEDLSRKYYAIVVTDKNKWSRLSRMVILDENGNDVSISHMDDFAKIDVLNMDSENFYFSNSGELAENSLEWDSFQSSVLLKWQLKDPMKPVDRFEVWRWEAGVANPDTLLVGKDLTAMEFEDKTVSPTRKYHYIVRALTSCEEETYTKTNPNKVPAHCVSTCTLEGYVRFSDGTGIPDINVGVTGKGLTKTRQVNTDDNGYYKIDLLPYNEDNGQAALYHVMVNGIETKNLSPECATGMDATFDDRTNYKKGFTFTVTSGYKFIGKVMYAGTSIPVKDANIRYCYNKNVMQGDRVAENEWHEARTSQGAVKTDFEGIFSLYVLGGAMSFQVFKPGHTFYQDGYYYNYFTENKSGILFYDDTKVKLIGRVTGGKVQGDLPLGNSLSNNNLGDSLKIMMTLEGDNTSYLVFDITKRSLSERDTTFKHKSYDDEETYKTRMHTTRHNITIWPDSLTGEYEVMLPPVKWKIMRVSAEGYPTLFQEGKVSEVIDLTDSLTLHRDVLEGPWTARQGKTVSEVTVEYNAIYNRIYQAPITIDLKQVGYDKFDYFGDRIYRAANIAGDKDDVPLAYLDSLTMDARYTFGYPVFNIDRTYPIKISVGEKYYYNNDRNKDLDVVPITNVPLTVRNGFTTTGKANSLIHETTGKSDENGEVVYFLSPKQRPVIATGEFAVRALEFSMNYDGVTYTAKPLKGYVLDQYYKPGSKDYLSVNHPILVDILRCPPGGASSSKLSKGSNLKIAYQMDMSWKGGIVLNWAKGQRTTGFAGAYSGSPVAGTFFGRDFNAQTDYSAQLDVLFSGTGQKAFSYSLSLNEDITASSGQTCMGVNSDVYLGVEANLFVKPAIAVRAIPDFMFKQLGGELKAGRMVEIATGKVDTTTYHLVRDEGMAYGQQLVSNFAHTQRTIIKSIIPRIEKQIQSLMFTGTYEEAKAKANKSNKPVYLSLRKSEEKNFAILNTDKDNNYVYYSDGAMSERDSIKSDDQINYQIVLPNGDSDLMNDEVLNLAESMYQWANMIARNEKEKLEARDLVARYDFDGGTTITYSEEWTADHSTASTYNWIGTDGQHDFWSDGDDSALDYTEGIFASAGKFFAPTIMQLLTKIGKLKSRNDNANSAAVTDVTFSNEAVTNKKKIDVSFAGAWSQITLTPVFSMGLTPKSSEYHKYNRKESFTLKMHKNSHLLVDVYRVNLEASRDSLGQYGFGKEGIFVNNDFLHELDFVKNFLDRDIEWGAGDVTDGNWKTPTAFVYRSRGGATMRPWEDEQATIFYQPGTPIYERTRKIENMVIKFEQSNITGVPHDQPARFKVTFMNESEEPTSTYEDFLLYLNDGANPNGARIFYNGMALTGEGCIIRILKPGLKTEGVIEVYKGEGFDFENLKIGLRVPDDFMNSYEAEFSAHFIPIAGDIAITVPGDKWIMNTDAQQDNRGYYMPVVISGYDKTQPNFDHIEFQYKESTRGDDYWTNVCSFYADSTYYKAANGTKKMIPENGYIETYFYGEGYVIEKAYDLRAVVFCRNGNKFITNASKVLSGIKDTRRPMLFGTPEPKDGILGAGDNIVFNFSENIEHNYLRDITNFEVTGETNETNVQLQTSLLFTGEGYAETEANRNFADKSVTIDLMVKPEINGNPMPLFSHGTDGKKLQFWLTSDLKLKAVVNGREYESKRAIFKDGFQHVALILDNETKQLKFYNDSIIGTHEDVTYDGYGPLIFGATNEVNIANRQHYKGRMLEARVWYRNMESHLNTYGKQLLTGYEMGLMDYYPMNEGKGDYIADKAQGAHAKLYGASWALPRGMSLKLDKTEEKDIKGYQLNPKFMSRTAEDDYTLMFWFKTDFNGRGALLSNGAGKTTDALAREKFFIGFEGKDLKYRTNGMEKNLGEWGDGAWHHYAMTVNRSFKVANIYIDGQLRESFATDTLGGMSGDNFYLGNMVWKNAGDLKLYQQNATTGNIDEVCLFAQALPPTLIKRFGTKSPKGDEKGLITYLGFNRQEWQMDGDYLLHPFALNQVIKKDMDGNPTEDRDTVFVESVSYIMNRIDQTVGASILPYQDLKKLNFSFVGRENQLLVNIDEQSARINKRNLYVTVIDIPDMNGNYMKSPATVECFVDRNRLRWEAKSVEQTFYDYGSTATTDGYFDVNIYNNSGSTHTYTIEGLPRWLTVDKTTDIIDPLDEHIIRFTVDGNLNVGEYDEIIYLTDEDGLSEPLSILVKKIGQAPSWYVADSLKALSMNIVARVKIGDAIVSDPEDIVAAFDNNSRCLGRGNIDYNAETGQSLLFLTVFDDEDTKKEIKFKLWHRKTGKTMILQTDTTIHFRPSVLLGSLANPLVMTAGNTYAQTLELSPGWNWISFNVYNSKFEHDVNEVIEKTKLKKELWTQGDIISDDTEGISLVYQADMNRWLSNKKDGSKIYLSNTRSYRVFVHNKMNLEITGTILDKKADRTITVKHNWNNIGYTPMVNLPVATALTEYTNYAEEGDVVKCKELFAVYTESNGAGFWVGTLKYMRPGEGYMLKRNGEGEVSFTYPFYDSESSFFESTQNAPEHAQQYASNMTMVAVADGIDIEEGDKLVAFSDGEIRGEGTLVDSAFYMAIAGDEKAPLSFVIERDGEIIAATGEIMSYEVNGVSGSPNAPTHIDFVHNDVPQHGWYTVEGFKLDGKPNRRGVYIYNGKKQVIK